MLRCAVCEEPLTGGVDTFGPIDAPLCCLCYLSGAAKLLQIPRQGDGGLFGPRPGKEEPETPPVSNLRLYRVEMEVRSVHYVMAEDARSARMYAAHHLECDGDVDTSAFEVTKTRDLDSERHADITPHSADGSEDRTIGEILDGKVGDYTAHLREWCDNEEAADIAALAEEVRDRQVRRLLAPPGRQAVTA